MGAYDAERHWPHQLAGIRSTLRLTFNGGWLKMPGRARSYHAVSGRKTSGGFDYSVVPETETYGRGGFFIHGGSVPGSAGCIDLWTHMESFATDLERELDAQSDVYCILTVDYNLAHRR
jgi:hypothetical protein